MPGVHGTNEYGLGDLLNVDPNGVVKILGVDGVPQMMLYVSK